MVLENGIFSLNLVLKCYLVAVREWGRCIGGTRDAVWRVNW